MLDPAKFKSGGLPWNRLKSQTIGDGCLKVTDAQMERVMGITFGPDPFDINIFGNNLFAIPPQISPQKHVV